MAQALPRDMRRRAASHDLNRLPAHLRARAAQEVSFNMKGLYWMNNTC